MRAGLRYAAERASAVAVIADPDLDLIAQIPRQYAQNGTIPVGCLAVALCGGVEAVANEIEEDPRHILRDHLQGCQCIVKLPFHRDVEALVLGAGTVVGEIEGFLDERVQIHFAPFAAAAA